MCTLVSFWRNRLLLLHQMSLLSVAETEALGTSNMDNGKIGNKSLQFQTANRRAKLEIGN